MKCCKCLAEIPEKSNFCMVCGAKQPVIKTCANCGTTGLPEEAVFCPQCGQKLNVATSQVNQAIQNVVTSIGQNTTQREKTDSTISSIPKDARDIFFPLNGFILGKTTITDAKLKGAEIDNMFGDEESFHWPLDGTLMGIRCSKKTYESYVDHISIQSIHDFPPEWKQRYNLSYETSYTLWQMFLKKKGFNITEKYHDSGFLSNSFSLYAFSVDGRLEIWLNFKAKDYNSLRFIQMDYNE